MRSAQQAVTHPRALVELTALHAAVVAVAGGRRRVWPAASYLMCVTHLGLLGERSSIGVANAMTLVRANLPVVSHALGPGVGAVALVSDVLDGRLARRVGHTRFGRYADALADAAFWSWYATVHERRAGPRLAAYLAWVGLPAGFAVASFTRGHMVDPPRPAVLRPAAALQVVLAARGLRSASARGPSAR